MRTAIQERAGKVIEAAQAAGMVYVPPVKYEIPAGFVCMRCKRETEHLVGCLPPFGLKVVEMKA